MAYTQLSPTGIPGRRYSFSAKTVVPEPEVVKKIHGGGGGGGFLYSVGYGYERHYDADPYAKHLLRKKQLEQIIKEDDEILTALMRILSSEVL